MPENVRRGYVPTDSRDFSGKSIALLNRASSDILAMVDRGYPIKSVTTFVGNHYQLSERQRLAIARAISPTNAVKSRLGRLITDLEGGATVHIDGLNVIISLETMLSKTTLIRCMDGTLRDLCGLRGTYKLIEQTDTAITLIGSALAALKVAHVVFYLDSPVSNTGMLSQRLHELLKGYPFEVETQLVPNADVVLERLDHVVTSDAIILNKCQSWLDLVSNIVATHYPDTPIVDFLTLIREEHSYAYYVRNVLPKRS